MTKIREIYRCQICGNVVEVVNPGAVLSCCGEPMKLMKENTSDGAKEKHVPVIEPIEGGYRVTVGSVEHPMLPDSQYEPIGPAGYHSNAYAVLRDLIDNGYH